MYYLQDLKNFAREMASNVRSRPYVLGLEGDLGAGKTTFAKSFIQYFDPKAVVISPTFSIVQYYNNHCIAHYDLYRIEHSDEFYDLDIFEDMQSKICLIEWPNRLQEKINLVRIDVVGDEQREITKTLV